MSNEKNLDKQEEAQPAVETPPAEAKKTDDNEHMIPKSRLDEEIQKRKDLEKRLAAIEKAHNEAENARLKDQQNFEALYEKVAAELADAKPKAEQLTAYETTLKETLASAIEEIPQERRGLIPEELTVEAQLRWISKNRALLSKAQPFDIGAGRKGGDAPKGADLTPEQKEFARKTGVSEEDYAKHLRQKP
jgi:DNA repair exonuclease SbcCD ATPase subunit